MRRMTGVAVGTALATAGLLATACGSNGSGSASNQPAPASPAQIVAAAYVKTTDAKTAKTAINSEISTGGQSVPVTASGVIDFSAPSADLTENLPQGAGSLEVRYLNGFIYEQLPPSLAQQLGAGKPWISIDASKIAQQQYGASLSQLESSTPSDPGDQLGYLRGASDHVTTVGKQTIDGAATTHYTLTLDLDKATANQPAQAKQAVQKLEQQLGTHTLPAQVWIDDQGRVRKLTLTETMAHPPSTSNGQSGPITINLTDTMSDFGTPVTDTAPSADQTTDITDQILSQSH